MKSLALHGAVLHPRTDPGQVGSEALAIITTERIKRVVLTAERVAEAVPTPGPCPPYGT